jgi:hypothetical protein
MAKMYILNATEREDGSCYYTSPDFPGFHYIMAPGEAAQTTLIPAFQEYLSLSARLARPTFRQKERAEEQYMPRHAPRRFTAELEFA